MTPRELASYAAPVAVYVACAVVAPWPVTAAVTVGLVAAGAWWLRGFRFGPP